jgi:hypothetical protein
MVYSARRFEPVETRLSKLKQHEITDLKMLEVFDGCMQDARRITTQALRS